MTTWHDVSAVPLQGGYLAKRCPVRAQNDALEPADPLPASPVLERRLARGRRFEAEVVSELLVLHPACEVIHGGDAQELEAATADAMRRGVGLIVNGRLPSDTIGRRVGRPDLLVAVAGGGYRPVDIKHHRTLEPIDPDDGGTPSLRAGLPDPSRERAEPDPGHAARKRKDDLLQLAHYQRILEAAGFAAAEGRYGGIVGVEATVVWHDLDAPMWRTPSSSPSQKLRSTMDVYDFEFAFRLDVIAVARSHLVEPSVELLVVPVRVGECATCPWWGYCRPQLEAGAGDVSLIPRVGWREWRIHRDRGVGDRAALARLDMITAQLVAAGVDVSGLIAESRVLAPGTPLANMPSMQRQPAQLMRLADAGLVTVADIARLSDVTASYTGSGLTKLPQQIDLARAALGPDPVYRRRGIGTLAVPRADVEVDVDMENIEEGVYLWGALLTDASTGAGAYHPFVTWELLAPGVAEENFLRFWTWLTTIRAQTVERGLTFRAYCYSESAENTHLRSLGSACGILEEVEAFIRSSEWVDMLRVFDDQLITGHGAGLKMVAPLAGFSWAVDDPGGGESMVYYDAAVGSTQRSEADAAKEWILTYNRGDVKATRAIRDWLAREGAAIPPIESLDP